MKLATESASIVTDASASADCSEPAGRTATTAANKAMDARARMPRRRPGLISVVELSWRRAIISASSPTDQTMIAARKAMTADSDRFHKNTS